MKVIYKRRDEIRPYPNNPRRNDDAVQAVAESIKRFGWRVPIVVDRDGEIVAGHTRYKAAEILGIDEIPCVIAEDLDEDQVRAFRLVDNKVGEFARWDLEKLRSELSEISLDMSLFGISLNEVPDFGEYFEEAPEKDPKIYTCPCCGKSFEL